jgi:hypothetical protein
MEIESLKTILEEHNVPFDVIDNVIERFKEEGLDLTKEDPQDIVDFVANGIGELELQMMKEEDWKKKASLAAKIIARRLEN